MANLTAAREYAQHNSTDSLALPATVNTSYYRGAAVALMIENATAANVGRLSTTVNGTVMANFIGVLPRNQGSSTGSADAKIALKRDGAVVFNAVSTVGVAATPATGASSWIGKTVWFHSDNEVSLTPIGQYPMCAGRVIATAADIGWNRLGSTEVLVEIEGAVRVPLVNWSMHTVGGNIAALNNTSQLLANAFTWARRSYVGRAFLQIGETVTGGSGQDLTLTVKKGSTAVVNANAITSLTSGDITSKDFYQLIDIDDTLTVELATTKALNAGFVNVALEVLPIQ